MENPMSDVVFGAFLVTHFLMLSLLGFQIFWLANDLEGAI